MVESVWVWGLPLARVTRPEAVDAVSELIRAGRPAFFITAGTHYAMLTRDDPRLAAVNAKAAFLVADGFPLVLGSRLTGGRLPERVAGSDLIYDLSERAARDGHRVFFLGAPPGVAGEAAARLSARYPGLTVAGVECPPFRDLSEAENRALVARIREARPDLMFVAFGQPKGELWLAENVEALGVPACVQVGASLDFVAGRFRRAPRWVQAVGMEWAYRTLQEPFRLAPRYARNAGFLAREVRRTLTRGRRPGPGAGAAAAMHANPAAVNTVPCYPNREDDAHGNS